MVHSIDLALKLKCNQVEHVTALALFNVLYCHEFGCFDTVKISIICCLVQLIATIGLQFTFYLSILLFSDPFIGISGSVESISPIFMERKGHISQSEMFPFFSY